MPRSHLKNPINSYISHIYEGEENIFKRIKKSIEENDLRKINIDEYEGKMLEFLISICNASKVIEVGTLAGYSTMWIAKALPKNGKLYTLESDKKAYEIAKANIDSSGYKDIIEIIYGDAHESLKDLASNNKGDFDAIFIDAEKRGYPAYLEWAEQNLKKGGLIIADNTFLNGAVYDDSLVDKKNEKQVFAMKEFNRRLADKTKFKSIILPTEEGLSVAIKLF